MLSKKFYQQLISKKDNRYNLQSSGVGVAVGIRAARPIIDSRWIKICHIIITVLCCRGEMFKLLNSNYAPELAAHGIFIWSKHDWRLGCGGPWIISHTRFSMLTWCKMQTCSSFENVKKLHPGLIWHAFWQRSILFEWSKLSRKSFS